MSNFRFNNCDRSLQWFYYTVKVNFKKANPAWSLVFVGGGMILPKHIYESYNGANAREAPANLKPVGTGAYRVVDFQPGDTIIYEPNPKFCQAEQLGFERIELKSGGDATSAARAVLQAGDADFAYNLQVEAPVLDELAAAGQGKVVSIFGALMERIVINHSDPNKIAPSEERSRVEFPHPSRYCNLEYDRLWQEASQELDPEKRQRLFIKMNDILIEDVAVIPLVHRADVMAFSNSLTGYEPTAWDARTWDIMNWRRKGNE